MRRIVLYFVLLGILSLSACNQEKSSKLAVLASIKPVQSIVLAIAGDVIQSQQLIPDYASPHHYAFKPSDSRKIKAADLIFRIDEHFEVMLNPALKNLPDQSHVIALAENPDIKLLPISGRHSHEEENKHEEEHEKEGKHEEKGLEEHQHSNIDMHVFTSPANAIVMATEIAKALSKIDPKHKQNYHENLQTFTQSVQQTSDSLKEKLASVSDKPYVVFHHSWQYFGNYFGLQHPSIIDLQEGVTTGSKTLLATRKNIVSNNIQCVFSDPSISEARVNTLIEGLDVKTGKIDVLQSDIALDQFTYINWLKEMGDEILTCLN
jgi:zinc transport system substrate-binding protein